METELKISIIMALALILTAFIDFRISAGLATVYLIAYAVRRMRKRKSSESVVSKE